MDTVSQSARSKRASIEPATYTLAQTAALLGCGYTSLFEQVHAGTAPVTPIRVSRTWKFPKRSVDRLLGLDDEPAGSENDAA